MISHKELDYKHLVLIKPDGRKQEYRDLSQREYLFLLHILSKMYRDRLEYAGHDAQEWRLRLN